MITLEALGQDPFETLVEQALRRLSEGEPPSRIEVERVDVKEEPGRRGDDGTVSPGERKYEQAASYLAEEMACMANTPGGGAPDNIITHPTVPRYRSLAEAMAKLGLAEREGIGVDRMVRDMLAIGRPPPAISQLDGPYVRVALLGGSPDAAVVALVAALTPPGPAMSTRFCSSNTWPGMAGWTPSPLRPSSNGPPRLKPRKRSTGWRRFTSTLTIQLP